MITYEEDKRSHVYNHCESATVPFKGIPFKKSSVYNYYWLQLGFLSLKDQFQSWSLVTEALDGQACFVLFCFYSDVSLFHHVLLFVLFIYV